MVDKSKNVVAFKDTQLPANQDELLDALESVQHSITVTTGVPFLKITGGEYCYGAEDEPVQEGSRWAINMLSMEHGWQAWDKKDTSGGPVGEEMVPANQSKLAKSQLPQIVATAEWKEAFSFMLKCLNGDDEGLQVFYISNSYGMKKWVNELLREFAIQRKKDPTHIIPIVELETYSYKHPQHGKTFQPLLNIVDWVSLAGDSGGESQPDEKEADEEPPFEPDQAATASKGADSDADAEPDTTRRRRRRAV